MLQNHIEFVNEQIAFQQKLIEKLQGLPGKKKFHEAILGKLEALLQYLKTNSDPLAQLAAVASGAGLRKPLRLTLTPADVAGLPEELLKELSVSEDRVEFAILNVLEEAGGVATLDQLLIGVYKKTEEILKRPQLTSRIYRMGQKELIWNIPGKKGLYSNRELTGEEVAKLIGGESENT